MEIIGYSERGAMNALFYGIALKKDAQSMKDILKEAGIEEDYNDFKVYSEFSLSDFGDPDMVIIADKKEGGKEVIFIEAKVSCGNSFDLSVQHEKHNNYVHQNVYKSGNSSNLFFQLRQKYYFFQTQVKGEKPKTIKKIPDLIKYYDQKHTGVRRTGTNPIVMDFINEIKQCDSAQYVAIIPNSKYSNDFKTEYGFDIHFVSWEYLKEKFGEYLDKTLGFNQDGYYNQILNKK